jgi:hypothetical protein
LPKFWLLALANLVSRNLFFFHPILEVDYFDLEEEEDEVQLSTPSRLEAKISIAYLKTLPLGYNIKRYVRKSKKNIFNRRLSHAGFLL